MSFRLSIDSLVPRRQTPVSTRSAGRPSQWSEGHGLNLFTRSRRRGRPTREGDALRGAYSFAGLSEAPKKEAAGVGVTAASRSGCPLVGPEGVSVSAARTVAIL
jgi:hypothetical protein